MNSLSALEAIFLAALDKSSAEDQAAYLDEACAHDPELRRQLDRLLNAQARAGNFLQNAASRRAVTIDQRPAEQPGTMIGPYKLLQQIGEGGMGIVFMAEQQEPVRRKVALKIIKPGMDSQQVIARFEVERQALALMDHPNIARVLDAGTTESGRPFFVMELVHGVPITQFCDDHHLTPRQRLALFIPVCQAIQHAHQKGIIHRDIKPSNVLVTKYDDKPVPKVIDFGVAKAIEQRLTEKTLFTQFGAIVGTFEYMSPEQAEMNAFGVDTRSDIYALGVLLYELLTGTTPLERPRLREAALNELVRLIKEEEAPRPSVRLSSSSNLPKIAAARQTEPARLLREVCGELDWIVLKCLEKDRVRRYETASSLAQDVERHLRDEPVAACPPSTGYRLGKLLRKHRMGVLTALALVTLLVAGVVVSTWQAVRALQAEQRAVNERDLKESARAAAERAATAEKQAKLQAQAAAATAQQANQVAQERLAQIKKANGILAPFLRGLYPRLRLAFEPYHPQGPLGSILNRYNWFPGPADTYGADSRLPASLVGIGVNPLGAPLPLGQLVGLWSEPPLAVVGLGRGTLAAYGRPFQHLTFYEMNEEIIKLSWPKTGLATFPYVQEARGRGCQAEILQGDVRLLLSLARKQSIAKDQERQSPLFRKREGYYQVFVVDVGDGDAIPVHLLTKEAFQLYLSQVSPTGVICVHTTNAYLELSKPVINLAKDLGLKWRFARDKGSDALGHGASECLVLAREDRFLPPLAMTGSGLQWTTPTPTGPGWTDDFSNLIEIFRPEGPK